MEARCRGVWRCAVMRRSLGGCSLGCETCAASPAAHSPRAAGCACAPEPAGSAGGRRMSGQEYAGGGGQHCSADPQHPATQQHATMPEPCRSYSCLPTCIAIEREPTPPTHLRVLVIELLQRLNFVVAQVLCHAACAAAGATARFWCMTSSTVQLSHASRCGGVDTTINLMSGRCGRGTSRLVGRAAG